MGRDPDVSSRANFRRSYGAAATCIAVMFAIAACSSRVVYERAPVPAANTTAININTATADELQRLPHIGRKTAEAIVAYREQNGPFRRPESLMQVRGVSESRFADIKPYITTE